jgi:integrase
MARRRYQKGTLILRGKEQQTWIGRWLEDEIREDGTLYRRHRSEVLGIKGEREGQIPTKKLALRKLEERLASVNSTLYRPKHVITFREMTERYKAEVLPLHKPATVNSTTGNLKILVEYFGNQALSDIGIGQLQRWIALQKCAPKTTRNRLTVFRMVWRYAKACQFVGPLDFEALILPERGLVYKPCFTSEQAKSIIQAAKEPLRTMLWVVAETGMRGGELCGLCVEDLNLADRTISVRRSAYHGKLQTPKTSTAVRNFVISAELAERLQRFLNGRKTGVLFTTRRGTAFDNGTLVTHYLKPILGALGLDKKGVGLHAFRHCNASILDALGTPMKVRMERLGHADRETTFGYTHAASEDHRRVADKLGEIFCPSLPQPPVSDTKQTEVLSISRGA